MNQGRTKGEGWSTENSLKLPPTNFKAALLFRFFGDFRVGALLLMAILVIYKYKKGKNSCLMLDWPVTTCMGNCCSPGCHL